MKTLQYDKTKQNTIATGHKCVNVLNGKRHANLVHHNLFNIIIIFNCKYQQLL